ncbi:MAG: hypothetical protein ABI954_07340 [Pyrinomonadaceae bacterium]
MPENVWKARTKQDLMIEVWEALDCESVGREEIEAIETAIADRFGAGAVESPMKTARLLADEGAELRHSEIMELDVERRTSDARAPEFRNLIKFSDFKQAETTFKNLENLRQKYLRDNDKEGLRRLRSKAQQGRERAAMIGKNQKVKEAKREEKNEIAEWFRVWLETPEIFTAWVNLRKKSADFQNRFVKHEN